MTETKDALRDFRYWRELATDPEDIAHLDKCIAHCRELLGIDESEPDPDMTPKLPKGKYRRIGASGERNICLLGNGRYQVNFYVAMPHRKALSKYIGIYRTLEEAIARRDEAIASGVVDEFRNRARQQSTDTAS